MKTNKQLAELLENAIEFEDIDAVWFVIGELEKTPERSNRYYFTRSIVRGVFWLSATIVALAAFCFTVTILS